MFVPRTCSVLACIAVAGTPLSCDTRGLSELEGRVARLEQDNRSLRERLARLERPSPARGDGAGLLQQMLGGLLAGRTPPAQPAQAEAMDPELRRRVDRLLVETLEKLSRSSEAKDGVKALLRAMTEQLSRPQPTANPAAASDKVPAPGGALVLQIAVDRARAPASEPLAGTVTLSNRGRTPVLIKRRLAFGSELELEVTDTSGRDLRCFTRVSAGRRGAAPVGPLAPGESLREQLDLLRYVCALGYPGTYRVVARYRSARTVRSAPIEIIRE